MASSTRHGEENLPTSIQVSNLLVLCAKLNLLGMDQVNPPFFITRHPPNIESRLNFRSTGYIIRADMRDPARYPIQYPVFSVYPDIRTEISGTVPVVIVPIRHPAIFGFQPKQKLYTKKWRCIFTNKN